MEWVEIMHQAVVEGVVQAFKESIKNISITGPKDENRKRTFLNILVLKDRVTVVHTSEVISPNEHQLWLIRKKRIKAL